MQKPRLEFKLGAPVEATDGDFGNLHQVILSPLDRRVVALIVRRAVPPPRDVVVPIAEVADASEQDRRQEKRRPTMAKVLTKSQIIQAIADAHKDKLARKDVANVLQSLANVGYKELKKNGLFVLPGFAKFVVIKKPATKERQGINPFTKEPMTFKAKPARKVLKARPVKAAKDAL